MRGEKDRRQAESGDYAKGSEPDQETAAPTGKEATTPGDETLPEDQATFQPEST